MDDDRKISQAKNYLHIFQVAFCWTHRITVLEQSKFIGLLFDVLPRPIYIP